MIRSAVLSPCGTYRYSLTREWDESLPALVWIMLNPSTADAEVDDPTIRRVVGFSRREGYGAATVVNLYGLRATDPSALIRHPDPVGPGNDRTLRDMALCGSIVAAWGAQPSRAAQVLMGPLRGATIRCLGTTKAGHPRHPLYVKADQPFEAFR